MADDSEKPPVSGETPPEAAAEDGQQLRMEIPNVPDERWCRARELMLEAWRHGVRKTRELRAAGHCSMAMALQIMDGIQRWGWIPFSEEAGNLRQAQAIVAEVATRTAPPEMRQHLAVTLAEAIESWRDAKTRILRVEGKALAVVEELWDRLRAMSHELTLASFVKYRSVPDLQPERDAAGQPVIDPATGKPKMRQVVDANGRPVDRRVPYLDGPVYLQSLRLLQSLASSITSTSSFALGGPSARVDVSAAMPTDEQLAYMAETGQLPEGLTFQQLGQIFAQVGAADEAPPPEGGVRRGN